IAAMQSVEERNQWKTAGLKGTLYAQGGAGQGDRELDLEVTGGAEPKTWGGVSGAPVFVGDRCAGMIKEVPKDFLGGRLRGVPSDSFLRNPQFRMAIEPRLINNTSDRWVLVLLSERCRNEQELMRRVRAAIQRFNNDR